MLSEIIAFIKLNSIIENLSFRDRCEIRKRIITQNTQGPREKRCARISTDYLRGKPRSGSATPAPQADANS